MKESYIRLGGVVVLHHRFPRTGSNLRPVTKLRIGAASAGGTHSLHRRTNLHTVTPVLRRGVAFTEKEISTSLIMYNTWFQN